MKKSSFVLFALVAVLILGGIFVLPRLSRHQGEDIVSPVSDPAGSLSPDDADHSSPGVEPGDAETVDPDGGEDLEDAPDDEAVDELVLEYNEDQGFTVG